jgi:hypothetical protein
MRPRIAFRTKDFGLEGQCDRAFARARLGRIRSRFAIILSTKHPKRRENLQRRKFLFREFRVFRGRKPDLERGHSPPEFPEAVPRFNRVLTKSF